METNNHQIVDYSAVLEAQYGALGTPERAKFDEEAYAFYTSQILLDARKNARLTQEELAKRIGANKSYISRINRIITGDEFFHTAFQDITLHTLLQSITVSLCFRTDPSMTLIHKCLPLQISQTSTSLCFIDLPEKPLPCKNIFADTFTIHKSTVIFTLRYNTP